MGSISLGIRCAIVLVALGIGAVAAGAQCLPAGHSIPQVAARNLRSYVAGGMPSSIRSRFGFPKGPVDSAQVVADSATCAVAARAWAATYRTPADPAERVWVIRVGTSRFLVTSGTRQAGDHMITAVFDSRWTLLGFLTI